LGGEHLETYFETNEFRMKVDSPATKDENSIELVVSSKSVVGCVDLHQDQKKPMAGPPPKQGRLGK